VPFLVSRLGSPRLAPAAVEIYAAAGIPVFSWPGQLAAAAAASVTFGTVLRHKPAGEYDVMRPLRSA
jgi:ABC-type sugar transport system substrate-binding protein